MMHFVREPLTTEEAGALMNSCQTHREKLIVWTLLETGLRVHELAQLTKHNIDWQKRNLIIYGKGKDGKKKRRTVPISDMIRPLLYNHYAIQDTLGVKIRTIQDALKRVANRSEIKRPVSPHVLRHTFAVESLSRGISIVALQKILGHENLQTTALYLNMHPEAALEEYKKKWDKHKPGLSETELV